ncbi:heparinase II/III family protein [Zhihengliuella sp.]|uniref:heparinase II/III domain-containing protein n=1 Tax=Zhihengliuella sp. TaxID=1954483 RepID=UPI002810A9D3|nr:heparinase II/III family protein [Zhihengliuella sp.]
MTSISRQDALNDGALKEYAYAKLPRRKGAASEAAVELFLEAEMIRAPRFGDLPYSDGDLWTSVGDRTRDRYLHGFLFLADWVTGLETQPEQTVPVVFRLVDDWVREMGWDTSSPHHPMAYHDETTAQRLKNWLLVEPFVSDYLAPEQGVRFRQAIDATAGILLQEDFHAGNNNHGMFQDLALRHYSSLASWTARQFRDTCREVALDRLQRYFTTCFTSEGVHVENSPSYHQMICYHLTEHVEYLERLGDPRSIPLAKLLHRAAEYATHAVTPAGNYPLLSDSVNKPLRSHAGRVFGSPQYDFAVTQGKKGEEPEGTTLLLPASGYAIHRSGWGNPRATWVMFTAAYNADYHKHSDDLSVVIHSLGRPLLSEAGPYGYNYKDPMTQFGFSQFAHNNVVVDGRSISRTDGKAETVRMTEAIQTAAGFMATAETGRLPNAVHRRSVTVATESDHDEVVVEDELMSSTAESRSWEMFWNIAPDLQVVPHGQGFEVYRGNDKLLDALIQADVPTQVSVHRGETGPRHLGWSFPEFGSAEPSDVVRVAFEGAAARLSTRFAVRGSYNYAELAVVDGRNLWKRSETEPQLNYLLDRVEAPGAPLVVVLSAIGTPGFFTYNYRHSLSGIPVNALYILDDFGDQGCYYLLDHGNPAVSSAVQELVDEIASECGTDREDVVFAGSSKGGAAALYHGITYGSGAVVVGAPQTRIGSFVSKPHPNILEFMTGGTSPEDVQTLDRMLFDVLTDQTRLPRIKFLVGEGDHHYKSHALPWVDHVRSFGHSVDLTVLPGTPHSAIGPVYRDYLRDFVDAFAIERSRRTDDAGGSGARRAATPRPRAGDIHPFIWAEGSTLRLRVSGAAEHQISVKLFRGSEAVDGSSYSATSEFSWKEQPPGRYRARVYYRRAGAEAQAVTTPWCDIR